jgi:hypothetical protein
MSIKSYFAERAIKKYLDKKYDVVGFKKISEVDGMLRGVFLGQKEGGIIERALIGYNSRNKEIVTFPAFVFGPQPNK